MGAFGPEEAGEMCHVNLVQNSNVMGAFRLEEADTSGMACARTCRLSTFPATVKI